MPSINVSINGRNYRMRCEEGEEDRLRGLADDFDRRIADVKKDLGEIGDTRMTMVAALMLADELSETSRKLKEAEEKLAGSQELSDAAVDRVQATQAAIIAALNAASERIEQVTKSLNQSLTDSVPMG